MCAQEVGLRSRAGADGCRGESLGEGQIGQPHGALGGFDKQAGIGCEVGVEA